MGVRIAGAAADDPDAILVENTVQGSKTEGRHGRGIQRLGIGSRQGVKFLVVVGGGKGSIFKMNCGSAWTKLGYKVDYVHLHNMYRATIEINAKTLCAKVFLVTHSCLADSFF